MARPHLHRTAVAGVLATVTLVAGACGGSTSETPASPGAAVAGGFGPPEKTTVNVGVRLPDLGSVAPFWIGVEQGFFKEEGLDVKPLVAEDVRAGVVGGSLDVGIIEVGPLAQAVNEGLELAAFSGYRCLEPYLLAVDPKATKAEDLAGREVLLGGVPGDPQVEKRLDLLAAKGWDLRKVDVKYVTVPGGSDAWVKLFNQGKLAVTPFFGRHRQGMIDTKANVVVDEGVEWPNDIMAANRAWLKANPNTAARFTRAMIKSARFYLDLANKDKVLEMNVKNGVNVEQDKKFYEVGPRLFCNNLYLSADETMKLLTSQKLPKIPTFEQITDLAPLKAAQKDLGLPETKVPFGPQGGAPAASPSSSG
ncbi:ABC transporter substrate-binding protein [Rhizohabitans arisaemae]|uniref:ABC transporter substrate-binding protein n=1 Tax=Rhizohabitans arisaemae TaxID=2720610 RepID=UPI0024B25180|nr:ABC transporter substrate-binding protein [Rhizohabitans arisaemae]